MSNKENTKRSSTFTDTLKRLFVGQRISNEQLAVKGLYDSPSKQAVKRFFRKPIAAIAFTVLMLMILFVFIAPIYLPLDLSYSESLHTNVAPNMGMMNLPSSMKKDPVSITSQGSYTLGLDSEGGLFTWGTYHSFNEKKNVMNIPEEVKNANILFAAAGTDHCIAIDDKGKVYGWGEDANAQFGNNFIIPVDYPMPEELINGNVDVENIKELICGNQTTAILMNDGSFYAWGNSMSSCLNIESIFKEAEKGVKFSKLCFTTSNLFGLSEDGEFISGSNNQYSMYKGIPVEEYIGNRKVIDIASCGDSIALLTDDGEILSLGKISNSPKLPAGEKIVSIEGGTRHFTIVSETGRVYAYGNNSLGQTSVPSKLQEEGAVDRVFVSGFQNYAFKDGEFVGKWGLQGYLMGTDQLGRDIFNRVVNGGKMTMTIGAVAVIVSSIIGIIVGCISGYFGGAVDILLMRLTEIFSAIPFLPFALVLSAVLQGSSLPENTRIFIIMIVLGMLSWTGLAKLVRGQILAEREKEFVIAAQSMGVKENRIAFRHILPNVVSVIIVSLTLDFASCMLTESSLSYLGFGVKLPRPTWGNMLDGCKNATVISNYWWRWLFPALFLAITVICINIIGDTLRDILDPKSEVEK